MAMPAEGWRKGRLAGSAGAAGCPMLGLWGSVMPPQLSPCSTTRPTAVPRETEAWGAAPRGARGRQRCQLGCGEGRRGGIWHMRAVHGVSRCGLGCSACPIGRDSALLAGPVPRGRGEDLWGMTQSQPRSSACISYHGNQALEVGFSSGVGIRQFKFGLERARNMLQHTGAAPLPLPSSFGPHLLHSTRHGHPFARSHISGADVSQVHEVHGLTNHGAVDSSPPLLRLWFLHDAAAQLVPEVAHI